MVLTIPEHWMETLTETAMHVNPKNNLPVFQYINKTAALDLGERSRAAGGGFRR